jgi:3,4-dihydroxyphenylacetate 2,3-dioxygenase
VRAGAAVHATAKRLGRRVVFVASTALSHALVRGRHFMPTPERMEADQFFIDQLKHGAVDAALAGFADYSRLAVAEMGGRALATLLGVAKAIGEDGAPLEGRQYGDYAAVFRQRQRQCRTRAAGDAGEAEVTAPPHLTSRYTHGLQGKR